jgi:hypothetical protein
LDDLRRIIAPGMVFKNYKEMCLYLGLPITSSNSKKKQMEMLSKIFTHHKDGNKIIIDSISEVCSLELSHGFYAQNIQPLILGMLSDQYSTYGNKILKLTTKQISERIGMVNPNYRKYANKKRDLSMEVNVSVSDVGILYNMYESKLRYNIEYSLDDLYNRKFIKLKKIYMLCYMATRKRKTRELSSGELEKIKEVETQLLLKYGTTKEYNLHLNGKLSEYRKELKEQINTKFKTDNIEFYYPAYKISLSKDIVYEDGLMQLLTDNMQQHMVELNAKLVEKCFSYYNKNVQKSTDKLQAEYGSLNPYARSELEYKSTNEYVENGHKLVHHLIKIDSS